MNERYKRLYTLPENLYQEGSPILIRAGALLLDTRTEKVLAQIKLKNLNNIKLIACKISIKAFDPSNTELAGIGEHFYLDLSALCGDEFGTQTPIYLPDDTTRKISASVVEAVYENGDIWRRGAEEWKPLPAQESITDYLGDIELYKQYSIEINGNCNFVPTTVGDLFLCACGGVNRSENKTCSDCRKNISHVMSSLNVELLRSKKDIRLKEEAQARIERERKIKEAQIEREHKAEEARIEAAKEENTRIEQLKRRKKRIIAIAFMFCSITVAFIFNSVKQQQMAEQAKAEHLASICDNLTGKLLRLSFQIPTSSPYKDNDTVRYDLTCTFTSSTACRVKGTSKTTYSGGVLDGFSTTHNIDEYCSYTITLEESGQILVKIIYTYPDGKYASNYWCWLLTDSSNKPISLEFSKYFCQQIISK